MANINVHSDVNVNIELSQEEIETLQKAYDSTDGNRQYR